MKTKKLAPVHPGEILLHDFMEPLGLSQYALAKALGVTPMRVSQIVRGQRAVTADTALRLSRYFGTRPGWWIDLQALYNLETGEVDRRQMEIESGRVLPSRRAGFCRRVQTHRSR